MLTTGCDGSVTGNSGDALTSDEAQRLMHPFLLGFGGGFDPIGGAGEFSQTIDEVFGCGDGGGYEKRGGLTGTTNAESGTTVVSVDFRQAYFNCDALVDGETLRLNGEPGVRARVRITAVDEVADYEFRITGGVDFETSDGRSGHCAIDINADISVDLGVGGPPLVDIRGTACRLPGSEVELILP
ncbi:MAG: hypothetical protein KF709_04955 [Gemmatimonadaceae bacterium]|nr:hypothetical protein [Gemmatimonadaceae bacterium]